MCDAKLHRLTLREGLERWNPVTDVRTLTYSVSARELVMFYGNVQIHEDIFLVARCATTRHPPILFSSRRNASNRNRDLFADFLSYTTQTIVARAMFRLTAYANRLTLPATLPSI